jgi:hypothetical protein
MNKGGLEVPRLLIGPGVGHRVESVRDPHDPGLERDALAA